MFETLRCLAFYIKEMIHFGPKRKALKATQNGDYVPGYKLAWNMAKRLNLYTGSRIVYHGLENLPEEKGVLFVSNHQSVFDIPVIMEVMDSPTAFVSKKELRKIPGVGLWIRMIGGIFMDRKDLRQSMQAILDTGEVMKKGLNMVIFPEGTRSKGKEHHEFKAGSLKPATMAKTAIVPVFIDGTANIFEANKGFKIKPAEVQVYFGKPISVKELTRGEQKALAASIEDIVFNLPNITP